MIFRRKKRQLVELESNFGKLKTEGFNFDLIRHYRGFKKRPETIQILSEQTCQDLDFDLFFAYVDRTNSKIGQQYLYQKLKTIGYSKDKIQRQEELLNYLKENPNERLEMQYQLSRLNDQKAYYLVDLFQEKMDTKPKWFLLFPLLAITNAIAITLSFFIPQFILITLGLLPIHLFIHYYLKRKSNLFINSIPALLSLGAIASKIAKSTAFNEHSLDIFQPLKSIQSIKRKMAFFKLEQKVDSDMESAYWFALELIKITFLLEPILLYQSLDQLKNKEGDIQYVFEYVGEMDSLISVLNLRSSIDNYCIPEIDASTCKARFLSVQHPLIPNCIPNDLISKKSILLTGSNMSGKTTFIRAIGLNYIAGMTLNTCFAEEAYLPIAELHSVIRIEDDIMTSSSYFFKELSEVKTLLEATKGPQKALILLDELFKGTNTQERIASAKAVLNYLENDSNQILVSTHDIELTNLLKPQYELFHFSESIEEDSVHFDYQLKPGIPRNGNAIRILDINGYPKSIVEEAKALVG